MRCSQAEQVHGTLGRARAGRSELPVPIPGQTELGHLLVCFPSLTHQPKVILTPQKAQDSPQGHRGNESPDLFPAVLENLWGSRGSQISSQPLLRVAAAEKSTLTLLRW